MKVYWIKMTGKSFIKLTLVNIINTHKLILLFIINTFYRDQEKTTSVIVFIIFFITGLGPWLLVNGLFSEV